jgi:hypothetical protein
LYLAIVAIWACFLIPAWLRRPGAGQVTTADDGAADYYQGEWADGYDPDYAAQAGYPAGYMTATESDEAASYGAAGYAEVSRRTDEYDENVPDDWAETGPRTAAGAATGRAGAARRRSQGRQQMMRARRRMLAILIVMTAVPSAFAYLGDVKWWISAPPAAMLVLYVLLLREIALADTELSMKRNAWMARQAQYRARQERARYYARATARAEGAAEHGAQIIDISARVGDQLYDQYDDAAFRAVGD